MAPSRFNFQKTKSEPEKRHGWPIKSSLQHSFVLRETAIRYGTPNLLRLEYKKERTSLGGKELHEMQFWD